MRPTSAWLRSWTNSFQIVTRMGSMVGACLFQWPKLNVLEPAVGAMVLQADITGVGVVLVGDVELVRRAIGTLVRFRKLRQVDMVDFLAIQDHVNQAAGTSDFDM